MLRKIGKTLIFMIIAIAIISLAAWAERPAYDPCTGAAGDLASAYKGISKVKPSAAQPLKVKPFSDLAKGFGGISQLNPMGWWQDCCLPVPAHRQFVVAPRVWFARVRGEVRHGIGTGTTAPTLAKFGSDLNLPRSRNTVWSIDAFYQFQPRWGFRYSFSPMSIEGTGVPANPFTFMGQSFTTGNPIHSKFERFEHRAGLVFDLSRTTNSVTSLVAEWIYLQDRLSVGAVGGTTAMAATWNDDKSLALLGLEFSKCLKNYRGSTLAFNAKGGVAFLDNHIGYEGEAALSYLIPVKRGRFGFIKGGYRYATLKKEKDLDLFRTTTDRAFVSVGFLF